MRLSATSSACRRSLRYSKLSMESLIVTDVVRRFHRADRAAPSDHIPTAAKPPAAGLASSVSASSILVYPVDPGQRPQVINRPIIPSATRAEYRLRLSYTHRPNFHAERR